MPADLPDALATAQPAQSLWTEITPLTRRNRIAKACSMLAAGKRCPCCFGGLNRLVKDHPATGGT